MGNQNRNSVHHGGAVQLGVIAQLHRNPLSGQTENRFVGQFTRKVIQHVPQGQDLSWRGHAAADLDPRHPNHVSRHRQVHRIPRPYRGQHKTALQGDLSPQSSNPGQKIRIRIRPDQINQVRRQQDFQGGDPHLLYQLLLGFTGGLDFVFFFNRNLPLQFGGAQLLHLHPPAVNQQGAHHHERQFRHAGDQAHQDRGHPRHEQRQEGLGELLGEIPADAALVGVLGTCHDNAGGQGHQQGGDLGDEAVAYRQLGVGRDGVGGGHAVHHHAHDEARYQVHQGDDDTGDGVAFDELGATVHGAVEVGFGRDFGATGPGGGFVDQARVQVGVDSHLFTGHGVQGEARPDFGHAPRTVGDDDEVDDDQDDENHHPDDEVTAHHEGAEGLDDFAGFFPAAGTGRENQSGRGHIQGQAEQRRDQHQRGENRELQGFLDEHGGQQRDHGKHDRHRQEHVHHPGLQRENQQHDDADDPDRNRQRRHDSHVELHLACLPLLDISSHIPPQKPR